MFAGVNTRERQAQQRFGESQSPRTNRSSARNSGISANIDRREQAADRSISNQDQNLQGQVTVDGTVEAFLPARVGNTNEDVTLARLRLENGQAITVDLGPDRSLSGLNINAGDELHISGRVKSPLG